METLLDLQQQGKIRALGVSNCSLPELKQYWARGTVDADQERYSMLDRQIEAEQLPFCREHGMATLAYSPMSQGLLTGRVSLEREFPEGDWRRTKPRFQPESRRRILELLAEIQPIADNRALTLAQLVLAWTLAQPGITHVLAGIRNPDQARENTAAGDVILTAGELAQTDAALERHGEGP